MKSRSVSVTGATGFVGWHVVERFIRDGWHVRAIVRRGNRKAVPAGAAVIESDLSTDALAHACAGTDAIVHAAGVVRAPNDAVFTAVNVAGTTAAASAAARLDVRFVLISSLAAGGQGTPHRRRREDDPPAPMNAYGRSKLASEAALRATGARWTILRPSAVYGPRDRGFLPLFRLARWGFFPLPTRPDMCFTFLYADDLARAVHLAVEREAAVGETLFVGHAQPGSGIEMLETIAASVGRRCRPFRIPSGVTTTLAALGDTAWRLGMAPLLDSGRLAELRAEGFVCAVDRARSVLGFSAETTLEDGISRTAAWYRAEGWL